MKKLLSLLIPVLLLAGCAGGPCHDYYNPAITDAHFDGPVTLDQVDPSQLDTEVQKCVSEGYVVVGRTVYSGEYPKANDLIKQAEHVGANHVVYRSRFVPAAPGSWHFGFGGYGGGGGTDNGGSDNDIYFLGK